MILPITGHNTCPNSTETIISEIDFLDDDLNDEPDSKIIVVSIDFNDQSMTLVALRVRSASLKLEQI